LKEVGIDDVFKEDSPNLENIDPELLK